MKHRGENAQTTEPKEPKNIEIKDENTEAVKDEAPVTNENTANGQDGQSEDTVSRLQEEITTLNDKWLRTAAELENTIKRAAKERQTAIRIATDSILLDFLEVLDNFDRALAAADEKATSEEFVKGIKLIHQQLKDTLARRGVTAIDSQGQVFNPDLHEAMMQVESDQAENTVVDVIQKGYMINDRVLRHARVTVSKPK